jgi:hypothetical protein
MMGVPRAPWIGDLDETPWVHRLSKETALMQLTTKEMREIAQKGYDTVGEINSLKEAQDAVRSAWRVVYHICGAIDSLQAQIDLKQK